MQALAIEALGLALGHAQGDISDGEGTNGDIMKTVKSAQIIPGVLSWIVAPNNVAREPGKTNQNAKHQRQRDVPIAMKHRESRSQVAHCEDGDGDAVTRAFEGAYAAPG